MTRGRRIVLRSGLAVVLVCLGLWLARAEVAWAWASYLDTSEAYRAYAGAWPASSHVPEALARQDARDWEHPTGLHAPTARLKIEDLHWAEARADGTPSGYHRYLEFYPGGRYVAEALAAIDDLRWATAAATNTVEGYGEYLRTQPTGRHAPSAARAVDELRWGRALGSDTAAAYEAYLREQLGGAHREEARAAIDRLAWESARAAATPAAYQRYLRQFPDGRFREDARAAYASFRAPVPGATYTGTTSTGSQVRLTVDGDGTTVVRMEPGAAAVSAATIASTCCYTVNSMALNGRSAIGDEDRAFSLTQRGSLGLLADPGTITVEAEAHGMFEDGRARGMVEVRFVDQPDCNGAPVSWAAQAP